MSFYFIKEYKKLHAALRSP